MFTIVALDNDVYNKFEAYFPLIDDAVNNKTISFMTWNREENNINDMFKGSMNLKDMIQNQEEWRMIVVGDECLSSPINPFDDTLYNRAKDYIKVAQLLGRVAPKLSFKIENNGYDTIEEDNQKIVKKEKINDPRQFYLISLVSYNELDDNNQEPIIDHNFWDRCNYPSIVRFIKLNTVFDHYESDYSYFKLFLLLHCLAYNDLPTTHLRAYELYDASITFDEEELYKAFQNYYQRLESLNYKLVQYLDTIKQSKKKDIDRQKDYPIQVEIKMSDLDNRLSMINNVDQNSFGYFYRDNDINDWKNIFVRVNNDVNEACEQPSRSIKKASKEAKEKGCYLDEIEDNIYLDEFQMDEIMKQMSHYEEELIMQQVSAFNDALSYRQELEPYYERISVLLNRRISIFALIMITIIVFFAIMLGLGSFFINAINYEKGMSAFLIMALIIALVEGLVFANNFIEVLKLRRLISEYHEQIEQINRALRVSKETYSKYYSNIASYMRGANLCYKTIKKDQSLDKKERSVQRHLRYIDTCITRVNYWSAPLNRKFKSNHTLDVYFNIDELVKNAQDCYSYQFLQNKENHVVLVNHDEIFVSPFSFIDEIVFEKNR